MPLEEEEGGGQVSASLSRHNLSHHFYHGSHYCRLSMRQCPPCPLIFSSEVTVVWEIDSTMICCYSLSALGPMGIRPYRHWYWWSSIATIIVTKTTRMTTNNLWMRRKHKLWPHWRCWHAWGSWAPRCIYRYIFRPNLLVGRLSKKYKVCNRQKEQLYPFFSFGNTSKNEFNGVGGSVPSKSGEKVGIFWATFHNPANPYLFPRGKLV